MLCMMRLGFQSVESCLGDTVEACQLLDVLQSADSSNGADRCRSGAQVAKASDFGRNDRTFFVRTHLGHLLHPGDNAMGFDMSTSNVVNPDLEAAAEKGLSIPDVILVDPPPQLALCLLACQPLSGPTCHDVTSCERVRNWSEDLSERLLLSGNLGAHGVRLVMSFPAAHMPTVFCTVDWGFK